VSEKQEREMMQSTVVRAALALLALGVVLVVVGLISYFAYRASRNQPLDVKIYAGAEEVMSGSPGEGEDHRRYVSNDPVEEIEAFYNRQDDMTCQRQYSVVQSQPGQETRREGYLYTRCIVDHSWMDITQYAVVTIQPVVENDVPTGQVVIDIERFWGG
jgi:hypothetical protein